MQMLASLLMLSGWTLPGRAGPSVTVGMGVISGLASPAGVAGPPAVMLVTALGQPPLVFRATLLAYFVVPQCEECAAVEKWLSSPGVAPSIARPRCSWKASQRTSGTRA